MKIIIPILLLIFATNTFAADADLNLLNPSEEMDFDKGIHLDLQSPVYQNGEIYTDLGGIISGSDLRIQAMMIKCTRQPEQKKHYFVEASGSLMVQYGSYLFIGERLEYDFLTKTGTIYNGRSTVEPWFFGGEKIYLLADGTYEIENSFATTSESEIPDWEIVADHATLSPDHYLDATNIKVKVFRLPVFWIPSMHMHLDWIFDAPIKYDIKWGGNQGHRFGLVYNLFSWRNWRAALLLEYRLRRGLGGGIESSYISTDRKTEFRSINYAARDSSIIHPDQHFRYRFQGVGDSTIWDDRVTLHLSYDKVSDIDMPTDFDDRGIELRTVLRTEFLARNQEKDRISSLVTHVRINNFQTIKEELPTFATSWRPFELSETKVIADMNLKVSYLDFSYGNNQLCVHNYRSSRLELSPVFYRHFNIGYVNFTPEIGGMLICYGNSPDSDAKYLTLGKIGYQMNARFGREYKTYNHVVTPYMNYTFYTMPTVSPMHHYIFDIEDGWYRLNMLRFGVLQDLILTNNRRKMLSVDLYGNAFFDTHTFPQTIPKIYSQLTFKPNLSFTSILDAGWDFIHNEIDHFNIRGEWTVNANIAASLEYRHRSRYDWRKADRTNFILDSYLTINELADSVLSDRRDTLLFHAFYRFHPSWAFEFESRHGWNRLCEPAYNEFEIELHGRLRSALNFKVTYQHREDDNRLSVYFSIGLDRPS